MKKYTEMTNQEINEIVNRGGDERRKLAQMVGEHLDSLELSQKARGIINTSDQYGIVEVFGGLFTAEEIERFVAENFGQDEENLMTLEMILKSGKIENEEQAVIFAENADFYYCENGWGDYRIGLEGVYAEIYAVTREDGEKDIQEVDPIPQDIRFYRVANRSQEEQIENPFK